METRPIAEQSRMSPLRLVRLVGVVIVGGALAAAGLVLLVIPGPGIPLLIGGLAILATEFAWAHRHLERLRAYARAVFHRPNRNTADGDTE